MLLPVLQATSTLQCTSCRRSAHCIIRFFKKKKKSLQVSATRPFLSPNSLTSFRFPCHIPTDIPPAHLPPNFNLFLFSPRTRLAFPSLSRPCSCLTRTTVWPRPAVPLIKSYHLSNSPGTLLRH